MGHIPDGSLPFESFDFEHDLEKALLPSETFNSQHWLYVPPRYEECRFILGERGDCPIICIGVNPSTAEPDNLDRTMSRVKSISEHNGYEGYFMLNVCAQRATLPDNVERESTERLHVENRKAFEYLFSKYPSPQVWVAWGCRIEKRKYFTEYLRDIQQIGKDHNARWLCAGTTKRGHPRHPLWLRRETKLQRFDLDSYLAWYLE